MEQQSTNIPNGWRRENQEVPDKPDQVSASVTHLYPTRQQKHQKPSPSLQAQKKPGRPTRVAKSEVPMVA